MISLYILETRCLNSGALGQTAVALHRPLGSAALRQAVDLVQADSGRVVRVWAAYGVSNPDQAPREYVTLATVAQTCGSARRAQVRAGYLDFAATIQIPAWSLPA